MTMQDSFTTERTPATAGLTAPTLALAGVLGLGFAAGVATIAHYALHVSLPLVTALTSGGAGKLIALALGLAALWAGSLWLSARQHARLLDGAPKPENCPQRRALNGCTTRGVRRLNVATMILARFRTLIADYPGRRVEDKMVLMLGVARSCRGLCLILLAAASMASLYGMTGR